MKKYRLLLSGFFVTSLSLAYSQTLEGFEAQANVRMLGGNSATARTFDNRYEGVLGYPMLLEKHAPARIRSMEGELLVSNSCNLDVYTNDLVILRNNQELVLKKNIIRSFTIFNGTDSLHFVKLRVSEEEEKYYQRIVTGKVELIKLHTKTFVKADYKGAYNSGRTHDEFKNGKRLFIKSSTDQWEEVSSKKDLVRILPEHQAWIEKFIKENRLDVKEESHLIALTENLNRTLIAGKK